MVAQLGALGNHVSAIPVGCDEAGVTPHRNVLGDRTRGDLERLGEIRARVWCLEGVQDCRARGSDQSSERVGRGLPGRLPGGRGAAGGVDKRWLPGRVADDADARPREYRWDEQQSALVKRDPRLVGDPEVKSPALVSANRWVKPAEQCPRAACREASRTVGDIGLQQRTDPGPVIVQGDVEPPS